MAKNKPRKRAAFRTYALSLANEPGWRGQWAQHFARPEQPLVVELGCAKAEFLVELALLKPYNNYVGLERKSDRLFYAARAATALELDNVYFLRGDVARLLEYFAPGEISRLWLTFPDPYPKARHEKHRMTNATFLDLYARAVAPGGWLDFKTDNAALFNYTLEVLHERGTPPLHHTHDLYHSALLNEENRILTRYERLFLADGLPTHYLRLGL